MCTNIRALCIRPQAHEAASGGDCTRSGKRVAAASMVPDDVNVGAVRVSANGWEAAVLEGLEVCAPPVGPSRRTCVGDSLCRRQYKCPRLALLLHPARSCTLLLHPELGILLVATIKMI